MIVLLTANLYAGGLPAGADSEIRALRMEFCADAVSREEMGGGKQKGTHDDGRVPLLGLGVLVELGAGEGAGAGLGGVSWGRKRGKRGQTSLAICSRRLGVIGWVVLVEWDGRWWEGEEGSRG